MKRCSGRTMYGYERNLKRFYFEHKTVNEIQDQKKLNHNSKLSRITKKKKRGKRKETNLGRWLAVFILSLGERENKQTNKQIVNFPLLLLFLFYFFLNFFFF